MINGRQYPPLIIFFGPDGSGKTTQALLLCKYLRVKKLPVSYIWVRGRHTLAYLLSNFFIKIGYFKKIKVPNGMTYKIFDPSILPKINFFWKIIEVISILPIIFIKYHIPRIFGFIIIADRYIIDTIAYLSYYFEIQFLKGFLTRFLFMLIPTNCILFHIDAKTDILISRLKYDIATLDYIKFQKKIYQKLGEILGANKIDTSNKTIIETFNDILTILEIN
ncbi:MAG: hypothetical protein ACFFDN_37690 [Candidatus Hodarchaeota archaeon]